MYENAFEFQIVIKKQEVNQFTSKLKLKGISLESLFWEKKGHEGQHLLRSMKSEDRHPFKHLGTLESVHPESNSSVSHAWKPIILCLIGNIYDFMSTERIKAEKRCGPVNYFRRNPTQSSSLWALNTISSYQVGKGRRRRAGWWLSLLHRDRPPETLH